MAQSSNRDDFFQTTASLEEQKRRETKSHNEHGKPIKLQSKILAVMAGPPNSGYVFVAQSGGTVRKIMLETGETAALYKGPTAPVTSLCCSPHGQLLFAGCWDKTVWSWDVSSAQPLQRYEGHTDFVKSVISVRVGDQDLLVSGGANAQVLVFDISTGQRLHTFKGHARGIQDLALDPLSGVPGAHPVIFSAGSDREIRQYEILPGIGDQSEKAPLLAHDTSVYKLFFDGDGDMWTASADKTARCLVREDSWKPNLILEHPDFVRDVVVDEQGGWVITACRDEEVRVWNRSTGDLLHTFSGHFEEVTGLALLGSTLVSVGIDATIRQWSLRPDDLRLVIEEANKTTKEEVEDASNTETMLTEEEERELAELMAEDDQHI